MTGPSLPSPRVVCLPATHVLVPEEGETLLDAARRADVPLASSCASRGVCGDCVVRVLDGAEALSPPDDVELRWRTRTGRGGPAERLACRCTATGDAVISTTYW